GWKGSLERKPAQAKGFYTVIVVSVLIGFAIQFSPISPMKALFWSAVINGVVAVPLIAVVVILASSKSVMGKFTAAWWVIVLGWLTTALMGAAALWMFISH
ncbi:MAG: divalent metal cation transporter, partial [Gammaproteobacteria bacterium]